MKRGWLIFLSLLAGITSFAQPQIHPDHPRIFFNSDTWPEIRERAFNKKKEYLDRLLAEVDSMPDEPTCPDLKPLVIKDITIPIPSIKEYGREAACCALAWRFTGEKKYLDKAKKMLTASAKAYTDATLLLRPVGWYSHTRNNALCAYDWIYEALSPEERREIIIPMVEHVEMAQPDYGLEIPRTNKGGVRTGFYGMPTMLWYSGLAAYGDGFCDSLASKHLKKGYELNMEMMRFRNASAGDDGGISSAVPEYTAQNYPYAQFNFMFTMLSATGRNIAGDFPYLPLYANWLWWVWIRDEEKPDRLRHSGFGDSYHNVNSTNANLIYEQLSQMMHLYSDMDKGWYSMTAAVRDFAPNHTIGSNIYPVLPFLFETDSEKADSVHMDKLENSALKARHFETLGQFYMRSGFHPDATYCTFTAGASIKQHKHYDENNFTIFKHDHLALDSGDRAKQTDYNLVYYYSQSIAHNVVLIHKPDEKFPAYWGMKQKDHNRIRNYGGMIKETGAVIKAFETNDEYTYIASDATSCYGDKCSESVRQFVFLYPDYVIVYDRISASDPSYRKEWLLHTQNEPMMKNNLLRADSRGGRLFCQTLLPKDCKIEVIGGEGHEFLVGDINYEIDPAYTELWSSENRKDEKGPYWGGWRIEVKPSSPDKDDRFLHVLTATSTKTEEPVKVKYVKDDARDGVRLRYNGRDVTFWFNREGKIGGEVITDGKSRPLTESVQKQSGFIF